MGHDDRGGKEEGGDEGKETKKRTFGRERGGGRIVASCHGCGVWPVVCVRGVVVAWVGMASGQRSKAFFVFGFLGER